MNLISLQKLLGLVLAAALVAGCASTDTQDADSQVNTAEQRASTAEEDAAAAAAAAAAAEREAAARLEYTVYFDFDTAVLSAETRAKLDAHVAYLQANNKTVRLEGHCDERGTREYNMALGERRAKAVADYLAANGVARYRAETVSYGEERPVAFGHDESAWRQNRRVEIVLN
ncbi:MAG TPA: peptidoglycan-associated lipoprotein Pal [Spongiibacteraceae bacterium]|jgi:peptidoglycan-associated lipoprotein|nr:peptidoglycan-associated lipoprotein Pal [Spongiibacteraceae bacterium]HUH38949.1 peptidoglycan-associated lipoprotein Pal [Spongiibacteraceae bacterium]